MKFLDSSALIPLVVGQPGSSRRASELTRACHVIVDVEHVKSQAQRLLPLHALRAADALQLAATLEWSGGRPAGRTVHTFDARLAAAARREGFTVPQGS